MLKEIFFALKGGILLYHEKFIGTSDAESLLISGFISAISTFANKIFGEVIKEINFSTTKLVIQEIKGKQELFVVCVTGMEIPLDNILAFQQKLGIKIVNYILEHNFDPVIQLREIQAYIKILLEEENFQEFIPKPSLKMSSIVNSPLPKQPIEHMVFIGLSGVGKSSIVETFFNRRTATDIQTILPTMGMKSLSPTISFIERPLQIYDLGGHDSFIQIHLQNKLLFINTLNLFFVIDAYDLKRIDSAIEYFNKIIDIIHKTSSLPVISIFLHKIDPMSPPVDSSIYWKLTQGLFPNLSNFNWAIYQTSVFSNSLDTAMIESFLRSLPEEYLAQSLSALTIDSFDLLIPMIINKVIKSSDIFLSALQLGKNLGAEICSKWIDYMLKDPIRLTKPLQMNIFAKIERIGRDIKFSLTWPVPGHTNYLDFAVIFQGLLTGILSIAGTYRIEYHAIPFDINMQYCIFLGKHV